MKKNHNEELLYYATIAVIIFIAIGLTVSFFSKNKTQERTYDTAALEKMIIQSKTEKSSAPETQPQGKVISPMSQYDVDGLRQSLNLPPPEKEEEDIKRQHEEILKNNPRFQYVF